VPNVTFVAEAARAVVNIVPPRLIKEADEAEGEEGAEGEAGGEAAPDAEGTSET